MKVTDVRVYGSWDDVYESALSTSGRTAKKSPSDEWKHKILMAEHSPIRRMAVSWTWEGLPYYVSVHFVRHKIGIEHFVESQRSDKTGISRSIIGQNEPVKHTCYANLQAIINISRKRLCSKADETTREAWSALLIKLSTVVPEICQLCVRECIYRGFCPEMKPCNFSKTKNFYNALALYRGE